MHPHPLHPQFDEMVERHNTTIPQYLPMFVDKNQGDWSKMVPLFLISSRSAHPESTTGHIEEGIHKDCVDALKRKLDKIHEFIRQRLK